MIAVLTVAHCPQHQVGGIPLRFSKLVSCTHSKGSASEAVVCQSNMTALSGEAVLFTPGYERYSPLEASDFDRLVSGYRLIYVGMPPYWGTPTVTGVPGPAVSRVHPKVDFVKSNPAHEFFPVFKSPAESLRLRQKATAFRDTKPTRVSEKEKKRQQNPSHAAASSRHLKRHHKRHLK